MRQALIIFIRNPVPGEVKTRLSKSIGDHKALEVYKLLLKHTQTITRGLSCDKFLYYSGDPNLNDLWDNKLYIKKKQHPGPFGEKMMHAFRELFDKGYEHLVIIGSDCLELDEAQIQKAFQSLLEKQIVIGPATDGGYYLLGMNSLHPELFVNKQWSSETVYEDTLADINAAGLTVTILPQLNDIDEEADLPQYLVQQLKGI